MISNIAFAQINNVDTLEEIIINASKETNSSIIDVFKEENKFNSVEDLLQNQTSVFIKSYGLGSLSTISLRGGSAAQSLVLWNGIPINNTMLGLTDFSLFPQNIGETVTLNKGLQSALLGNAAITGVVNIDNNADFTNKLSLAIGSAITSFSGFKEHLNFTFGNKKFQSSSKIILRKAKNDFPYRINENFPIERMSNAATKQINLLQSFYWKLNQKSNLNFHYWHLNSDRNIPPNINQNESKANRIDLANRFVLDYNLDLNNAKIAVKTAYLNEHLNYFDEVILLESRANFEKWFFDFAYKTQLDLKQMNVDLNLSVNNNLNFANIKFYDKKERENQFAIVGDIGFGFKKFAKNYNKLILRQVILDNNQQYFIPNFNSTFYFNNNFKLKLSAGKSFRLPGLNDRFWKPGGNENLKSEIGWDEEVGLIYDKSNSKSSLKIVSVVFNRITNNWILWSPNEITGFLQATNLARVYSRGIEQQIFLSKQINVAILGINLNYQFVKATNQIASNFPKLNVGDQLIYTPEHTASLSFSIKTKFLKVQYHHKFVEKSKGINNELEAYNFANLQFNYQFNKPAKPFNCFLKLNNIYNNKYFVIENRPMPKFNFEFGINYNINKKQKI